MYQGKRLQKKASTGLRWQVKNAAMLVPALALLLTLSVGGTVAFLVAKGTPVRNEFTPSTVSCQVIEEFNGEVKTDVAIQNTGDTEAYIRAAIVVTWKDAKGGNIYAVKPREGEDYSIVLNNTDWVQSIDGLYYHKEPVAAGQNTQTLIENCSPKDDGKVPAGYELNVEILGSAIQSVPTSVVTAEWSSGVSGVNGGTLSIK